MEVLLPIHFIVAEIKPILFDQPKALPSSPTSVSISGSLKRIKTLPLLVPFHCAPKMSGAPYVGLESPAEIVMLLKCTSSQFSVF